MKAIHRISAREASGSGDAPDTDRTIGEAITDIGITMSGKSRLLDDPQVKGLQISKDTKGVRDVQSNLTIDKS